MPSWHELFKGNEIKRVGIDSTPRRSAVNVPEEFAALGEKLLQAEQGKKKIIIMMDEVLCRDAPEDKEQASYNWIGLDKIPDQLTIILMFNPGFYTGYHLLLPPSCLRLVLYTTYRSTKSISNLHACLATADNINAPCGNPGTEVVGELPRLLPLGKLGEEEEATEKIRYGLKLMRGFMGTEDVTVIIDDVWSDNIGKLVRKETEESGWQVKTSGEMTGAEADRVVYIGGGCFLEEVSRARLFLGILLCYENSLHMRNTHHTTGYRAAIEQGLVLVAALPSHPKVACNCIPLLSSPLDLKSFQLSSLKQMLSTAPHQSAAAEKGDAPDPQQFLKWKGKAAAETLLPDVEEESSSSQSSAASESS